LLFADILRMETKTANLDDACEFASAIHAEASGRMLSEAKDDLLSSFEWSRVGRSSSPAAASRHLSSTDRRRT
jgi:isocitrate lyase